jgi:hypothetical protein
MRVSGSVRSTFYGLREIKVSTLNGNSSVCSKDRRNKVQFEYLDLTVHRREVGEVFVVVGRAPACWQVWRGM